MDYVTSSHYRGEFNIQDVHNVLTAIRAGRAERLNPQGGGGGRRVYSLGALSVLKLNTDTASWGDNATEWEFWENETDLHEYLAPCIARADDASWLVMARCRKVGESESYHVTDALEGAGVTDLHDHNLGTYHGRTVALDYAANEYREICDDYEPREECAACGDNANTYLSTAMTDVAVSGMYCRECLDTLRQERAALRSNVVLAAADIERIWALPIVLHDNNAPILAHPTRTVSKHTHIGSDTRRAMAYSANILQGLPIYIVKGVWAYTGKLINQGY